MKFLSAISAIVFTFLAGADPRRQPGPDFKSSLTAEFYPDRAPDQASAAIAANQILRTPILRCSRVHSRQLNACAVLLEIFNVPTKRITMFGRVLA